LICSFRRVKYISDVKNYFDLNNEYYLLMAKGELSESIIVLYKFTNIYKFLIKYF
jgi:hypothetical protein